MKKTNLTIKELAAEIGYHEQYLYQLVRAGTIPYQLHNGVWYRFDLDAVKQALGGRRRRGRHVVRADQQPE